MVWIRARHQRFLSDKGSTSHKSHFSLQTGIAIFIQPNRFWGRRSRNPSSCSPCLLQFQIPKRFCCLNYLSDDDIRTGNNWYNCWYNFRPLFSPKAYPNHIFSSRDNEYYIIYEFTKLGKILAKQFI